MEILKIKLHLKFQEIKHLTLLKTKIMIDIKEVLPLWFIIFFNKKNRGSGANNETKQHQHLAKELHELIIKKFKTRKVYSSLKDNILGADLPDMQF